MHNKHLIGLDSIRGIAIIMVVFTHWSTLLPLLSTEYSQYKNFISTVHRFFIESVWVHGGVHIGVMIFIVLSGFLIHYPQAKKEYKINVKFVKNFILRRFFRVYPVLIVGLFLGIFVYIIKLKSSHEIIEFYDLFYNLFSSILAMYAFLDIQAPSGNIILVTVIVEIVLYIAYIFLLPLIQKEQWPLVFLFAASIYLLNIILNAKANLYWFYHNGYSFLLYWLIGAYFADFANKSFNKSMLLKLMIVGCVIFLSLFLMHQKHNILLIIQAISLGAILLFIVKFIKQENIIIAFFGKIDPATIFGTNSLQFPQAKKPAKES